MVELQMLKRYKQVVDGHTSIQQKYKGDGTTRKTVRLNDVVAIMV